MSTISNQQMSQDLREMHDVAEAFFSTIKPTDWDKHTEAHESGWTLRQTLAHVTAIAETWQEAIHCALISQPIAYPGLAQRTDLAAYNQQCIEARQAVPTALLIDKLLRVFKETADQTATLTTDQLGMLVPCPAYNRPLTAAETIGCQMSHLGIVHGAQLTRAISAEPLWQRCSPAMQHRLVSYFFNQVSHAYWVERGGNLHAGINFYVGGQSGGRWHLTFSPDGGTGGEGWVKYPALMMWSPHVNALCNVFTGQLSPSSAILRGQILGVGNLRLAFRLPELLVPT